MRRVVVTGIGCVSPLGGDIESSWNNLISGKSGIKKVTNFDTSDLHSKIAGLVPIGTQESGCFDANHWLLPKEQRKVDKFIIYGIAAATQAIEDSGWKPQTPEQQYSTGVLIGSGIGGLEEIHKYALIMEEKGARRVSPFLISSAIINLISGHVSIKYGFKGPNHAVVTACATSSHAIGDAARFIKYGDADVMVAGGAEAPVIRLAMAGFGNSRALSSNYNETPEKASRPWDKGRDGFVISEGSASLVLEELEHAKQRGAKIYGEILGYGLSGDAYHITSPPPDGDGAARAINNALKDAKVETKQVDYVNAHGTSTPIGDVVEVRALKKVFQKDIYNIPVSSTKSSTGHLLGATGSLEAIFTLLSLKNGIIPPTLNLEEPDEECDLDFVPNEARKKDINIAISNSFGFGGTNVSLVLSRYND